MLVHRRDTHLCPGLNAATNFTIFRFSFKCNKVCDFSFTSTRFTNLCCLNDFSACCEEIKNFMPIPYQQAPACRFYKIYKICDFSLSSLHLSHAEMCDFFCTPSEYPFCVLQACYVFKTIKNAHNDVHLKLSQSSLKPHNDVYSYVLVVTTGKKVRASMHLKSIFFLDVFVGCPWMLAIEKMVMCALF